MALIADGLSIGEARRRDYDKTVLGFLGEMAVPALPTDEPALSQIGVLQLLVQDLGLKDPVVEEYGPYVELVGSDPTTGRLVEIAFIVAGEPR